MLLPLLALIAASGCEKANDVARLKEEAMATVKEYQERFDELAHRADVIGKRGNSLPPDTLNAADAKRIYTHAVSKLEESHGYLRQVPPRIQAGVTNGNPEDLPKLLDELRDRLEDGVIEATSELSAVESWIAVAEQRRASARIPPPPSAAGTVLEGSPPVDPASDAPIR